MYSSHFILSVRQNCSPNILKLINKSMLPHADPSGEKFAIRLDEVHGLAYWPGNVLTQEITLVPSLIRLFVQVYYEALSSLCFYIESGLFQRHFVPATHSILVTLMT